MRHQKSMMLHSDRKKWAIRARHDISHTNNSSLLLRNKTTARMIMQSPVDCGVEHQGQWSKQIQIHEKKLWEHRKKVLGPCAETCTKGAVNINLMTSYIWFVCIKTFNTTAIQTRSWRCDMSQKGWCWMLIGCWWGLVIPILSVCQGLYHLVDVRAGFWSW